MANNAVAKTKKEQQEVQAVERTRGGATFTPRVDILETPDSLILYADVPGCSADDIDVRFENGELVVHGRCTPQAADTAYMLREYGVGDFYRAFTISESIDASRIEARVKNGVLTLHLPKAEKAKPKRIAVKTD